MVKLLAIALLGGCTLITDSFVTNGFSGDPYPIAVRTDSGAIVVGLRGIETADQIGIIDILSPVTISDPKSDAVPRIIDPAPDVTLLGEAAGGTDLTLPRATFVQPQVIELHPCDATECDVGPGDAPVPYEAIIGADTLSGDALRLRLIDNELFVLPDIAGDDRARTYACDAAFDAPFRGGGTMIIGGTELDFSNERVTVQACLAFDADISVPFNPATDEHVPQSLRGADVLLVASTALGISILSESAYQRYRDTLQETPPDVTALPVDSVFLPSGLVTGHRGTITNLALVAASSTTTRAPCRQVYSHHLFTDHDCAPLEQGPPVTGDFDCPCTTANSDQTFCGGAPAIIELTPAAGIDVLVVSDADPTLQALGTELSPDQPQVDGILGTAAMHDVELDLDYPHDRVLGRCTTTACSTRPELLIEDDRPEIQGCLASTLPNTPIP